MSTVRIVSSMVLALGALLAVSGGALAQSSNCQWYASTALRQQQDNERLKCGFSGADWHSDLRMHAAWCAGVSPDAWKRAARSRDQQLSECQGKGR